MSRPTRNLQWLMLRLEAAYCIGVAFIRCQYQSWPSLRDSVRSCPGRIDVELMRKISQAVHSAEHHLPLSAICFPVAMATLSMCRRRGLQGTVVWLAPTYQGDVGHVFVEEYVLR